MKRIVIISLIVASCVLVLIAIALVLSFTSRDLRLLFAKEKIYSYKDDDRKYLVSEPKGSIDENSKLVIALHGFTDTPKRFAYYTAFHNSVDDDDVVVYPRAIEPGSKGIRLGWNSGFCCGSGWVQNTDDSGYISELTSYLVDKYGVSKEKVFVVGHSNGAFMAQRLVIDNPGVYSGLAVSSGTIGTTETRLTPIQPLPILLVHGGLDKIVSFDGGVGTSNPELDWLSFAETVSTWQKNNKDTVQTEVKIYEGNGHKWNDWRLFNFWNRTTEQSGRVNKFFDNIST